MQVNLESMLSVRGSVLFGSIIAALVMVFPRAAKARGEQALDSSPPLTTHHSPLTTSAKSNLPAKIYLTEGWATFGLVLPPGVGREGLKVGSAQTQTDVKTRWPDGSIRFSVVTTRIRKPGDYEVQTGPRNPGKFQPEVPPALVRFTMAGVAWTARLPAKPSGDIWLAGPLATEWRATVAPVDSKGSPHPFLRVLFDVRCLSDGKSRVDITAENALDVQGATMVTYDVDISIGDKNVFRHEKVTHPYLTRWRKVFAGDARISDVIPDLEPFYQAHALPRYLSLVENRIAMPEGPAFDILQKGDLNPYMPDHGGRPELAPYPDWTARYLVHQRPIQSRYVLAHGDLAGSWPVHIREPEIGKYRGVGNNRLVSIDERPNFWLDSRADPDGKPCGDLTALGPLVPDNAHVPSLAYVPYLITGDRYYADEMSYWANFVLLRTFQDGYYKRRGGSKGLLTSNEPRGIAWGLRNMVDAAAYLPDGDPVKAYLADKIRNNLEWADKYAQTHVTPLGTYFEGQGPEQVGTTIWAIPRPWQNNYIAWSLDHALQQGFAGGQKLRDRLVNFQLQLFTSADYSRSHAGAYTLVIGKRLGNDQTEYFKSLKQVFHATYGNPPGKPRPFPGYYGVDARLMLMIARQNGWAGAEEAYNFLFPQLTVPSYDHPVPDLARRAGWAIAFDGEP